ncbi:hypothetical protein M406DRAFT_328625 [Cryphonectria parasitica EP155]|uniref:Uncharacterized protein n=1 Tax=Cryphonectria parasitica (strain ATCC 38755 / EP155) TaxID=660469 RepID=A0A9P5CQI4_CRYP1|nr:uncharacterized protein M406DRAFT_328625 [Cryphonectria parasitica EP155]KAF3767554.1 hypothetical protein M406DRAFT_328625 [Cryphonectria parasitica EP155]
MKTIPATIVLLATVNATQATTASLNPFSPMPATGDTTSLDYKQTSTLPRHVNAMGVGSSCAGSEGAWYCMSSAFQRCASGQWSRVVDCAEGTVCEPEGLSYEFQTAFGISAATDYLCRYVFCLLSCCYEDGSNYEHVYDCLEHSDSWRSKAGYLGRGTSWDRSLSIDG